VTQPRTSVDSRILQAGPKADYKAFITKGGGGTDGVHRDALPDRTEFPELLQVPAARQTSHKRLIRAAGWEKLSSLPMTLSNQVLQAFVGSPCMLHAHIQNQV
jgi:hypothetical protein